MNDSFKQEPIVVPPGGGDELNMVGSQFFHKVKSGEKNNKITIDHS